MIEGTIEMTLTIQRLTKPTQDIEDFLRQDIPLNGLPLYDLTLAWDLAEWYIVKEDKVIQLLFFSFSYLLMGLRVIQRIIWKK